jgi:hypothetical protein
MALNLLKNPSTVETELRPFAVAMLLLALPLGFITPEAMEFSSFFLLMATGLVCWRIFERERPANVPALRSPARIWLLISVGFYYLALDEAVSIHEGIDKLTHWLFSIVETPITDRLDDLIVLVYGIVGIVVLVFHREEFRRLRGQTTLITIGFLFLVLMVFVDTIGNRIGILLEFGFARESLRGIRHGLKFVEEFFKLPGEVAFLTAFARIYAQLGVRSMRATVDAGHAQKA